MSASTAFCLAMYGGVILAMFWQGWPGALLYTLGFMVAGCGSVENARRRHDEAA